MCLIIKYEFCQAYSTKYCSVAATTDIGYVVIINLNYGSTKEVNCWFCFIQKHASRHSYSILGTNLIYQET